MNIPEEIKKKIDEGAIKYSTHVVKGAKEWEQKDPSKKKHFIDGAEFGYSLSQSAIADKDKEIEKLKREKSIGMELCVEFGYVQCEKGNNIQAALINYQALNPKMI